MFGFHKLLVKPVLLVVLLLMVLCSVAQAQGNTVMADQYRKETRAHELKMLEAQQTLLDLPAEEWTDSAVETYLFQALFTVYCGAMTYIFDGNMDRAVELDALVSLGYVQHWPGNPFNEWEPMAVLGAGDDFLPGELCLQVAPETYRDGKAPYAYELCVYGPDMGFAALGNAEPMKGNQEWAIIPGGALYMLGAG